MKPVFLEDDVYEHLGRLTLETGQSPSACLRAVLNIADGTSAPMKSSPTSHDVSSRHELSDVLEEPVFRTSSSVVTKMLRVLKAAHDQRREDFATVLSIRGRDRHYFARSRAEIANSGKNTQPHEIRGTGYWV